MKHRAVASSGACTALEKSVLDSVLVLGSMVREGIDKNWLLFSVWGHSNRTNRSSSIRDRSDSSNRRSSPPGARTRVLASILPGHNEEVAILFCIAYPTVVFIILPLPERPGNILTSTLTLSGSFFEHLTGGWFRNRFALSCVFVLRASACFFPIREESCASFSSIVFCPVLGPAIPRFFRYIC